MTPSSKPDYEMIRVGPDESFAVRAFNLPAFASTWHFHHEIELTSIISSRGQRFVGDSIEDFGPGDLVLIGGNLPHYWYNSVISPATGERAHSIVIQFRQDCLGHELWQTPEMRDIKRLLEKAERGLAFHGAGCANIAEDMKDILHSRGAKRIIKLLAILQQLSRSVEYRYLSSQGFKPILDHEAGKRINDCHRFVFDHFDEPIRLEDVANTASMTRSAFCRYFKKATGGTFSRFVNEVRVGHACRFLIESRMDVGEICYASGYNSLSNFNRRFKELKGITPREYRKLWENPKH